MKKTLLLIFLLLLLTGCGSATKKAASIIKDDEKNETIENKKKRIPDVIGLTISDTEKVLVSSGFEVNIIEEKNSDYEEGTVFKTNPTVGRTVDINTVINVYVSSGNNTYIIEDYTGHNYIEVKAKLETLYKMEVLVKEKEVAIEEEKEKIIEQSIAPGTEIKISEDDPTKIILYIPSVYDNYPDFVSEGWNLEEIEEWAGKYNITVNVKEKENGEYPKGTVIEQSRTGKIVKGVSITITIAK